MLFKLYDFVGVTMIEYLVFFVLLGILIASNLVIAVLDYRKQTRRDIPPKQKRRNFIKNIFLGSFDLFISFWL